VELTRILVPVNSKPDPQLAANAAMRMARSMNAKNITFRTIYAGNPGDMPEVNFTQEHDGWNWDVVVSEERNAAKAIVESAMDFEPQLIVMATEGHHGFMDAISGTVTERVMREVSVPLLAVPKYVRVEL
jgi:hypothetical protein